jgi:hypothetical protein
MNDPILSSPETPRLPPRRGSGLICVTAGTTSLLLVLGAIYQYSRQIEGDGLWILALGLCSVVAAIIAIGAALFESHPRWHRAVTAMGTSSGGLALVTCLAFFVTLLALRARDAIMIGLEAPAGRTSIRAKVEPIIVSDEARTATDYREAWRAWLETHAVEPVMREAAGRKDEAVTREILEAFVKDWTFDWDRLDRAGWNRLAARYAELDQHHPTPLMIVGARSDYPVNVASGSSVVEKLRQRETNPFWLFYLEMQRADRLSNRSEPGKDLEQAHDHALAAFDRLLAEQSFAPEEMWLLGDFSTFGFFPELFKARADRVLEIAESHSLPEWYLELLRGRHQVDLAWKKRGSGYSNTVNSSGWEGFSEHLEIARTHLQHSWELEPTQPNAAKSMITVSMGSSPDPVKEMRLWLDLAAAAQADNWPAYEAYLWGMRPRWHGSHEEMLDFADECLATGRYDTNLPLFYLSTVRKISEDTGWEIYRRPEVYEGMREVLTGYLDANPSPSEERSRRTTLAVLAHRAGRYDDLREQWTRLEGKPQGYELGNWSIDRHELRFRGIIGAGSGALNDALAAADAGDFARAIDGMERAVTEPGLTPEQNQALASRLALVRIADRYEKGEWIDLFQEDRSLWRVVEGRMEFQPDGSMALTSDTLRYAVDHPLTLGEHFEVEFDLETKGPMLNESGPGILLSDRSFESKDWITYYVNRRGGDFREFVIAHHRYSAYHRSDAPKKDRMTLRLVCHDKEWKAYADSKEVHPGTVKTTRDFLGKKTRLALGGWTTKPIASHLQVFHGVRVRKLGNPGATSGKPIQPDAESALESSPYSGVE